MRTPDSFRGRSMESKLSQGPEAAAGGPSMGPAGGAGSGEPLRSGTRGAGAKSTGSFPLIDRRLGLDRRQMVSRGEAGDVGEASDAGRVAPTGENGEQPESTGLERRRGAGRRRTDFLKSADEGELTPEQFLFLMAIDAFKKSNSKMYPTWSDVLEVIRLLGYRKTMPSELNLRSAEDWQEPANAPAKVKTIERNRHAA